MARKKLKQHLIWRGTTDYGEYLGEYGSKVEIVKISKSGYDEGMNGRKNSDQKISCYCPFKGTVARDF